MLVAAIVVAVAAVAPAAVAVVAAGGSGTAGWRAARCRSVYPAGWSSFCKCFVYSSKEDILRQEPLIV